MEKIMRKIDENLKSSSGKLNADSGFGFQAEFISGKPGKDVGFSDTRITDKDDLKQIIVLVIDPMSHAPVNLLSSDLSNL